MFHRNDLDELPFHISDSLFEKVFNLFEKYNFTIREDLPLEVEVAVDPQMIGYVYESLSNVAEEIYERQDLGIFYTPTVEVDFMCQRSVVEYLTNHPNPPIPPLTKGARGGFSLLKEKFLSGKYEGNKWGGKYLRAPDIFFTILEKGKGKLVRLGDIAEVRFGIKTGVNDFFFLDAGKIKEWNIEREFLKPVLKNPRESKNIILKPSDLKYKIFMCHKDKKDLKDTNALK